MISEIAQTLSLIPWYGYAILSAVLATFFSIIRKKALESYHSLQFESARTSVEAVLVLLLIPFVNFILPFKVFALIYIVSLLAVIGIFFISKSYKHMQLSVLAPLTNIKPAVVGLLAYLILGEELLFKDIAGIIIILIGAYILEADHHFSNLLKPIKQVFKTKYSIYLIFAVIIFSFTSILDKVIISNYADPLTMAFFVWIFIAINFNILHGILYGFKEVKKCFMKHWYLPVAVGALSLGADILAYKAMQSAYISLVTPLLMLSTLFIIFFGGSIFKEKNLLYRMAACGVILLGALLLVI